MYELPEPQFLIPDTSEVRHELCRAFNQAALPLPTKEQLDHLVRHTVKHIQGRLETDQEVAEREIRRLLYSAQRQADEGAAPIDWSRDLEMARKIADVAIESADDLEFAKRIHALSRTRVRRTR